MVRTINPTLTLVIFILMQLTFASSMKLQSEVVGDPTESQDQDQDSPESPELDEIKFVEYDDEDESPILLHKQQQQSSEDKCPPIPDIPEKSLNKAKACEAETCISDQDCRNHLKLCCHNGCVRTCLRVDMPRAFDWLEETELKETFPEREPKPGQDKTIGRHEDHVEQDIFGKVKNSDEKFVSDSVEIEEKNPKAVEIQPETIFLPGGCYLNFKQYEHLEDFKRNQHFFGCSCDKGEVLCEVNPMNMNVKST